MRSHAVNKVVVDPNLDEGEGVEFITIGSKGTFTMWKLDEVEDLGIELVFSAVTMKEELKECDFVTATYTPTILTLGGQAIILLGTAQGELVAYNPKEETWVDRGNQHKIMSGQIGYIIVRNGQCVVADSSGHIARYPIPGGKILPPEDPDVITTLNVSQPLTSGSLPQTKTPITALVMDELNVEGIIGTAEGNVHYVNFQEKMMVKLVSRVSSVMEPIDVVSFDSQNQQVFLTNCGLTNGDVKLYTSTTVDQIMNFPTYSQGPVKFILTTALKARSRVRIIGHTKGILKFVDI